MFKRNVKTTTWPLRHTDTFTRLSGYLSERGLNTPVVLEVGPGAATKILSPYYPSEHDGRTLSWVERRWRTFLRKIDSIIRRIPNIELYSFEPGELRGFLPKDVRQIVADISAEVITAIQKQYPNVEATVFDFSTKPFKEQTDAIVCLCVLVRTREPKKIFKHLYDTLKPGGILVMDNRSVNAFAGPECTLKPLSFQIWQKV
ncbi:MAG: class I SAM-dependent methyltransferase [Gammaproteobacteria bacterium]